MTQRGDELAFSWNGETIVDTLTDLEYFYPSTVGTAALFYHGSSKRGRCKRACAMAQLPDPVAIDVGANIGVHSLAFANAKPQASIFALEPIACKSHTVAA